jgi:hypothetical protein
MAEPPATTTTTTGRSLSVVTEPERKPLRRLTPLDPPMLPLAVGGTVVWLVLGLVLLAMRSVLAEGGNESWIAICFAGAGFGLIGMGMMAVHDHNRSTRR